VELIKITRYGCMSCIAMEEKFDKLKDLLNKYELKEINTDENLSKALTYNIGEKLPIYIIMDNNKEVKRLIGEHNIDEVKEFLS